MHRATLSHCHRSSCLQAMEQQEAEAKLPSAQSLVDGALSIAVSSPDVSYSVASLLSSAASANAVRPLPM